MNSAWQGSSTKSNYGLGEIAPPCSVAGTRRRFENQEVTSNDGSDAQDPDEEERDHAGDQQQCTDCDFKYGGLSRK